MCSRALAVAYSTTSSSVWARPAASGSLREAAHSKRSTLVRSTAREGRTGTSVRACGRFRQKCASSQQTLSRAMMPLLALASGHLVVIRRAEASPERKHPADQRDGLLLQRHLRRGLWPDDGAVSMESADQGSDLHKATLYTWEYRMCIPPCCVCTYRLI